MPVVFYNLANWNSEITADSQCSLNSSDDSLLYVTIYLEGNMQSWIDCEDNLLCFNR